jgi:signal transduction histidine kinase
LTPSRRPSVLDSAAPAALIESPPPPDAAERIVGRYEILKVLGEGSEGVVYSVRDHLTGRRLALKRPHSAETAGALRAQFFRLASVHHPNVAAVDDYGVDDTGLPFMTMEILHGQEATSQLFDHAWDLILPAASQVAAALEALHLAGWVHADLKPENILWVAEPHGRAVLADLGLAHAPGKPSVTAGTPEYMAPEVVLGAEVDARADFYSLGVTLFEWIAGRRPFAAANEVALMRAQVEDSPPALRSLVADLPPVLDELVARLLEKDPSARVRSAREVIDALSATAEALNVATRVAPPIYLDCAFRGRDSDLRHLRSAWVKSRRQKSLEALLLAGESGSGKSRLLAELRWRARWQHAWVGDAVCDPDAPLPFSPLATACAPLLQRLTTAQVSAWSRDYPGAIALSLHGSASAQPAALQVTEALQHLITLLPRPALLIIDDAEHAAPECLEVLTDVAQSDISDRALLLLVARGAPRTDQRRQVRTTATAANGPPPTAAMERAWKRLDGVFDSITLAPLPDADIEQIAKAILGASTLSTNFRSLLASEAHGIPGRVPKILRALDASDQLRRSDGAWTVEVEGIEFSAAGFALDADDRSHVAHLVSDLEPGLNRLLLHAALLRNGTPQLLARATRDAVGFVRQALPRLENLGLIALDEEGRFSFPSRELTEAVITCAAGGDSPADAPTKGSVAPPADDRLLLARAACATALALEPDADPLRVARLALGGRKLDLATEWVLSAIDALGPAASIGARRALIDGLIALQNDAEAPPVERAEVLWQAIDFVDAQGDHAAVEELGRALLDLADETTRVTKDARSFPIDLALLRAHAWRWIADARLARRSKPEEIEEAIARGLQALDKDTVPGVAGGGAGADAPSSHPLFSSPEQADERVHLLHLRAMVHLSAHRPAAARPIIVDQALPLVAATPDPQEQTARLHGTLAQALFQLGEHEAAAHSNSIALDHHERSGDLARAAAAYNLYGLLAHARNAWKAMSANLRKALSCTERMGDMSAALVAMGNLVYADAESGQWDDALAICRRGRLLCERLDRPEHLPLFQINAGIIYLWRGDLAAAEELFRATADVAETAGAEPILAIALGNLGDCALARERLTVAKDLFERALALTEAHGMIGDTVENQRRLTEVLVKLGDENRAWKTGSQALRQARRSDIPYEIAQLCRIVGIHHENHHRYRRAEASHRRAVGLLDSLERRYAAAIARHRCGIAAARGGDLAIGLEYLARAESVYQSFGARGALAQLSEDRANLRNADQTTQRAFRKMEILLEATQAINAAVEADETLRTIIDSVMEVSEAERGFMITRDKTGEMHFVVSRLRAGGAASDHDVSRSVVLQALDRGIPYVNTDLAAADQNPTGNGALPGASASGRTQSMLRLELKSVMCVPLRVKEQVVGAIYVDNHCSPATGFQDEDLGLLQSLASIAATAMERARLYSRLLANYRSMERQKLVLEQAFSRLQEARDGLIQAEKLSSMGILAASIAHELKQPLTAIRGRVEMLSLLELPADAAHHIAGLQSQAERMDRLVKNMNGYVRQSSGERSDSDPRSPVEEALALVGDRLQRDQIEVSVELAPTAATVHCDPARLQQVFINLITNAADAMEGRETRHLQILAQEAADRYEIRVTDTGEGIPPARISTIFKMFETSKPKGKGVGMGLAIVRGIVEDHGGEIRVESRVDQGTTFTVSLPLHR